MFDVVGIGAASIDFVYQLPEAPRADSPAAKLRISQHLVSPGGQTATVLCTCASLGLRTKFVGTLGHDPHAATLAHALHGRGVNITDIISRPCHTPYAVILVDERHGERIVLWHREAACALTAADIRPEHVAAARVVHVDDVDVTAALTAADLGRAAGARVTSDIEQVTPLTRALVEAVDVAIFAEHVPQALVPGASHDDALRVLQTRADQLMCVTMGARGAMLLAGGELYRVAGHAVPVVDTTGAGDVFRGAFITALLRGDAPADILRVANAAAAASCTKLGAIGGVPTMDEVDAIVATRAMVPPCTNGPPAPDPS